MTKFSITGQESGASDLGMIVPVDGDFLIPFKDATPNECLTRHRAAIDGYEAEDMPRTVMAGNWFEGGIHDRFEIDFDTTVEAATEGFKSKDCNLVASLDGIIRGRITLADHRDKVLEITKDCVIDFKFPHSLE